MGSINHADSQLLLLQQQLALALQTLDCLRLRSEAQWWRMMGRIEAAQDLAAHRGRSLTAAIEENRQLRARVAALTAMLLCECDMSAEMALWEAMGANQREAITIRDYTEGVTDGFE